MSAASNLAEPFTLGMGFSVQRFSEEAIEVAMPGGWRNRGDGGLIHSGALTALGETTVRMYWDYHLDFRHSRIEATRVQVRIIAPPDADSDQSFRGVFRLPESDREAILHRLRVEQSLSLETQTSIYDRNGRLIAEVEIDWRLSRRLMLSAPGAEVDSGDSER